VSDGATASNWVTAAGGGATGLVPGAGADVVISANSVATAPTATVLGADMAIKTLTISDTANGLGVSGDDYALTITPTDPGTGITVASGVPASTIGSNVVLGAPQTWTNNSASALTVSGAISGTVGLTKAGEGTLILSGDNPYTGDTTVSAGTLKLPYEWAVQNSTVIMGGGSAAVVFDSAETANAFWFGGLAGSGSGAGYDIALQNNDPNTLAIALTVGSNNANTAYAGLLSGGGSLTKRGAGTLTLSNAASTYAGVTNIAAGTMIVSKLADGNSPSSIGQSPNVSTNLLLGNGTTLKYVGAGDSTDRQFRFNGNLAGLSITLDASGTGPINFTSATGPTHSNPTQTRTLNLIGSNTGDNTLAANIGNNGTGVLSVVKSGEGTWVLSGTNTYTGATTVSGGKLLVEGDQSLATGAVTVADVGTLGGNGVIGGAVTVNGTLAPGTAGIGTLTVGTGVAPKNVAMAATAIYNFDITSPTNADTVDIMGTGIATFASGWQVVLSNGGGGAPKDSDMYYLFSYDAIANATTLVTPAFSAGTTGWIVTGASIGKNSTGIYLTGISSYTLGDTNGDKVVDATDYIAIKTNFGLAGTGITRLQGDLIDNDVVDWDDLQQLMNAMATRSVGGAPATPEPATLGLLAIGALALLRRRRRA
jgi:fibronectin-binding autotransporter adhesin